MALLIHAVIEAVHWRDLAFRHVPNLEEVVRRENKIDLYGPGPDYTGYDLVFQVDYAALFSGAIDLGYALDEILSSLTAEVPFSFRWDSPLGVIFLNCRGEDNIYGQEPYLLLIDCSGDDTYAGTAGAIS